MATWIREWAWQQAASSTVVNSQLAGTLPVGGTLLRARFRVHLYGSTSAMAAYLTSARQVLAVGLCSVFRVSGSSSPLDPTTPNIGQTPPAARWLWWDAVPVRLTSADGTILQRTWEAQTSAELASSKGMVKADTPAGEEIDVYACWKLLESWDPSGLVGVSSATELLTTP